MVYFLFSFCRKGAWYFLSRKADSGRIVCPGKGLNTNLQEDVLDMTACFAQYWIVSLLSCPSDLHQSVV